MPAEPLRLLTPAEQEQASRLLDIISNAAGLMDGGIPPKVVTVALIDVLIAHAEAEGYTTPHAAALN